MSKNNNGHSPLRRQWEIVRLLAYGRWTIGELAERFAVTQRSIRRDFRQNEDAGFPPISVTEPYGRKRYRLRRKTIPPLR